MRLSFDNNWFCCSIDNSSQIELCKIKQNKGVGNHSIVTYYDGKEVYSGSLSQCQEWIKTHWIEKRYLENYGKN